MEEHSAEPHDDARVPVDAEAAARRDTAGGSLTDSEVERAAELEARIVAEERAAEEAQRRGRSARTRGPEAPRALEPLAVRAADEYAYVRRDVLRIARIGGLLLGVLAALYILIDVTHTIAI